MNLNQAVCNYAPLRFLPDPKSGEFVNVGVIVNCLQPCLLRFQILRIMSGRGKMMFPEEDDGDYTRSSEMFYQEVERKKSGIRDPKSCQFTFNELVRPRENTFRFGEVRTILTATPETLDVELFRRYVLVAPALLQTTGPQD